MEKNLVEVKELKQYFQVNGNRGQKLTLKALDGVSLSIREGETMGLVGESGCGKSTLGKAILQLYTPTAGEILFDGKKIDHHAGKNERKEFSSKVQLIFQDPSSCLNPRKKIREILEEPYVVHHLGDKKSQLTNISELCELVGLSNQFLERYPHEMSGGQKQRIGIARALALRPKLVVCDEPVSALDVSVQAQVINLLLDLREQMNLTYLFISHDLSVVKYICQRICVMYLGRIVEIADAEEIYRNTMHPYTKALISAIPVADPEDHRQRIILKGEFPSPVNPPSGCAFHPRCPQACEVCKKLRPKMKEVSPGHFVSCHLYD